MGIINNDQYRVKNHKSLLLEIPWLEIEKIP